MRLGDLPGLPNEFRERFGEDSEVARIGGSDESPIYLMPNGIFVSTGPERSAISDFVAGLLSDGSEAFDKSVEGMLFASETGVSLTKMLKDGAGNP